MPQKPPVDLYVEVSTPDGSNYRWDAQQAPGSRLGSFTFRTRLGDGFSDASGQLSRRIDQDYSDLQLANGIKVVGHDGTTAYEGRVEALPRELSDVHSIGVTCAGWMVNATDTTFSEVYVDRDLAQWQPMSPQRRSDLLTASWIPNDPATSATGDGQTTVRTSFSGQWVAPYKPTCEAWYDIGSSTTVGRVSVVSQPAVTVNTLDTTFQWYIYAAADDRMGGASASANLIHGGEQASQIGATSTYPYFPKGRFRYAALQFNYNGTPAGQDGVEYGVDWYRVAVYGTTGLPLVLYENGQPEGVRGSDVIKDIIARFCPMLNADGVKDTGFVIPHLVYRDQTKPFDAFIDINKYHLWHLGCWDDRTVHFRPYDMGDWDWEVRTDGEAPAGFSGQGDSTQDLRNGIVIQYQDIFTGKTETLRPESYSQLKDNDPENPWNRAGYLRTGEPVTISIPTNQTGALYIGSLLLGDSNRPKAPGTVTVQGHIKNRIGNWEPAWRVRAGDRLRIASLPFDGPRLVTETSYDVETRTMTITVENGASGIESLFDRITTALVANNLSV